MKNSITLKQQLDYMDKCGLNLDNILVVDSHGNEIVEAVGKDDKNLMYIMDSLIKDWHIEVTDKTIVITLAEKR